MSERFSELFDAVRAACEPDVWSRGVELGREGAVVGEPGEQDEVVFRVARRAGMISHAVTFFVKETDWDCECPSRTAGCEHVAAAAIAWRRALEEGREVVGQARGSVGYRFGRSGAWLSLERVIVRGDESHPLQTSLVALADRRVHGPRFVASQADLAVELSLGTHRSGVLAAHVVPNLFKRLALCEDVCLDDSPVSVSAKPIQPHARLIDEGEGFRLFVDQAPDLDERFDNGIGRCGDTLRPIGELRLTGRELHELPRGRRFGPDDVAELLTEVLPSLRERIPVEVLTERLPQTIHERPRIAFETERDDERLSVLATMVYGDPPRARINAGRLVHIEGPVPLRDGAAERSLVRRLRERLQLAPGVRAWFDGEEAVAFAGRIKSWEERIVRPELEHFRLAGPLVPRISVEGTRLLVEFQSGGGATREPGGSADPGRVLGAFREGHSLVPLNDGGWAPLPHDWLARYGNRLADLLAAREPGGAVPRACLPDLASLCEELDQPLTAELAGLRDLAAGFSGIPEAALPADLATELRDYQREGIDWLIFMRRAGFGAMLADDMGLGKTLQALCAVSGRTLVVAPTSVIHNWVEEARKHRPELSTSVYHGPRRELDPAADLTVTTYALLRLDADRLGEVDWDTVVLDEAQAIKNPESGVAGAAFRLRGTFRMTLTGTPVENRLDELWSQFHFANRGLLGGRKDFRDRYALPISVGDAEVAARLRRRIRPFLLRRLKQEVAPELPPRTEMLLHCELDADEREVYEALRLATRKEVLRKLQAGGGVMEALEALLRLRQAACHTGLLPGKEAGRSSKVEVLLETLDSVVAEEHKALVFSQWTSLLDLVEPHLDRAGIPFLRLDGSTRNRAEVVRGFQTQDGPPVLLISLKAGGSGLNLTAADHVFLLDPWWNPAVEDQAADRAHRIGQDRPVMIYRLVAEGTVEERILALQQAKRDLAGAALEGADRVSGLNRDDLLDLLR